MMRAVASGQVAVLTKPRTARGCAAHSQLDRHCSGRAARAKAAIEVPPGCSRCGVWIRKHAREPARDRQATVALPREWPLVAGRQCPRATRWLPSAAPNYSAAVSRPEPLRPATRNLVGGTLVAVALRGRPAREPRGAGRSAAGARSVSRPVRCRPGARIGEQPSPCGLPQLAVPASAPAAAWTSAPGATLWPCGAEQVAEGGRRLARGCRPEFLKHGRSLPALDACCTQTAAHGDRSGAQG